MKRVFSVFLGVFMLLNAVSCGKKEDAAVKIGVILPLSGSLVSYGKNTLNGIKLSVKKFNAAATNRKTRRIQLIIEDNKGTVTDSRSAIKKLAASDGVAAIIGPITSTNALAVRREAAKLEVPVLSPTATNDKVTLGNPYVFRACFNDSFQGKVLARFAVDNRKYKKAAILTDMNSDYSKGLAANFKNAFSSAGGKIVADESYRQKDTEFGVQLKRIKEKTPDTVFVPGYPPEVPLIIRQAEVVGLKCRLCGADGWDNPAVIDGSGPNIAGCFIVGAFSREDKRVEVRNFIANYHREFGSDPDTFGALGYDSACLIEEALNKEGSSRQQIKRGLERIKGFEAVTGTININAEGDVEKSAVILEIVKDGNTYKTKYLATVKP